MSTSDLRQSVNDPAQAQSLLFKDRRPGSGLIEDWKSCFPEIIGRSQPMLRVLETVSKIARSESAVLIFGESGTGKELIASALHRLSTRSDKPFVAINCGAIPENLLESELFGHEKGAFTGADRRRPGRFDAAAGGTIFLDEIGDMPLSLQAKLLRVLQDKRFTPLGGNETREADVRIVAATNVDLEAAVKKGLFRLDLFYRLNVLPIHLPALRERSEDIPGLLDYFIESSNRTHPMEVDTFLSPEVVETLSCYAWPGNIRQLQNLVERLVVLRGGGMVSLEHLPNEFRVDGQTSAESAFLPSSEPARHNPSVQFGQGGVLMSRPTGAPAARLPETFGELPAAGIDLIAYIEQLENNLIIQALERTNHNKNQAAKLLGLNRTTLVERIKKRQILPLNSPSKEL